MENLSTEQLKTIVKENRKAKNKVYWAAWNILNNRYNAGEE